MGFWLRRGPAVSVSFSLMRIHPAETSIGGTAGKEGEIQSLSLQDPQTQQLMRRFSQSVSLLSSQCQSVSRSVGRWDPPRQAGRQEQPPLLPEGLRQPLQGAERADGGSSSSSSGSSDGASPLEAPLAGEGATPPPGLSVVVLPGRPPAPHNRRLHRRLLRPPPHKQSCCHRGHFVTN